jgi:cation diffusion facilitator family transporter
MIGLLHSALHSTGEIPDVDVGGKTIFVIAVGIFAKLALLVYCNVAGKGNSSVEALAQDHGNDVMTNVMAVIGGSLASAYSSFWWLDPLGAIFLSVYIIYNWTNTGKEQLSFITGESASNEFLGKLAYIASHHSEKIQCVDTVIALHFGFKLWCEVHIVLPKDMSLLECHDIGESLERKIERLDNVERCFVHMDYESEHTPERKAGGEWDRSKETLYNA